LQVTRTLRRTAALAALLAAAPAATAAAAPTDVLVDPFTNPESNHATVVEPDTFAAGGRIVAVAQIGRHFDGGASGNGFATWTDAGAVLASGALPGLPTTTATAARTTARPTPSSRTAPETTSGWPPRSYSTRTPAALPRAPPWS